MSTARQRSTADYPRENDRLKFFSTILRRPLMDFDARYRGEPRRRYPADDYTTVGSQGAQGESHRVAGRRVGARDVLDIGCGLGDNAIYLAKNGYLVTGQIPYHRRARP